MCASCDTKAQPAGQDAVLSQILESMRALQIQNEALSAKVESMSRGSASNGMGIVDPRMTTSPSVLLPVGSPTAGSPTLMSLGSFPSRSALSSGDSTPLPQPIPIVNGNGKPAANRGPQRPSFSQTEKPELDSMYPSRVILTTYPGQVGIKPVPLIWGAKTPEARGPILASRHPSSIKVRNSIGAYAGSYSIYKALAIAMNTLDANHRPDYTDTEPPFSIPPQPSWFDPKKIVSLDPFGHMAQTAFAREIEDGLDIRPTISVTKAHIKMSELDNAVTAGTLPVDGKIVQASVPLPAHPEIHPGVELNVSKAAVEPVWFLPGLAERFGISEGLLRRSLFEETGGMYPELLTRPDLKTFLPPIGGLTVYIFGNPAFVSDPTKELTLRVHDECNGSDVFGSDICTCRPYLIYGIEEAAKCAQRGGVGVIVYFRKEGRALGEVTKYLVYNSRKRNGDKADRYFKATENIAGVKDMRFQALMPDVLHWLGIQKIDNMISMSDMKHDAIVDSGIPIVRRYELPADLMPPDSLVEIHAKIAAGYFSNTQVTRLEDTVGRAWEDLEH